MFSKDIIYFLNEGKEKLVGIKENKIKLFIGDVSVGQRIILEKIYERIFTSD